MLAGFFPKTELQTTGTTVPPTARCGACGLHKQCRTPKMRVAGQGVRKVLVVGEAPGETEDALGKPFMGKAGRFLRDALGRIGVDLDRDCWTTNAARCRPPKNKLPDKAVDHCRPFLVQAVKELQPEVVILLGSHAVKSMIGWLWREDPGGVHKWSGWRIPCREPNAWICPTFHPSHCMRCDEERNPLPSLFFAKHLKAAFARKGRPWKEVPDEDKEVDVLTVPDSAVTWLDGFRTGGIPVAFDFETDRLKPDNRDSRIVSCSVSDGTTTIAYPWHGEAIKATKILLRSEVPKIGSNIKFEERWTRRHLGIGVKNWIWDTMIAAHVLDNRPGITSIKFQAFALLGAPAWDDKTKPYLESGQGGNGANQIRDCDLPTLLRYNGLDSLYEWQVAQVQAKRLGAEL